MWILDLARFTQQPLAPAPWVEQRGDVINGGDVYTIFYNEKNIVIYMPGAFWWLEIQI